MDYVRMGDMLRERRLELRLTKRRVADGAGISEEFYCHIERGTRKASLETVVALAEFLCLSVDALVDLKGRSLFLDG